MRRVFKDWEDGLSERQDAIQKGQLQSLVLGSRQLCWFGVDNKQKSGCCVGKCLDNVAKLLKSVVFCFRERKTKTNHLGV